MNLYDKLKDNELVFNKKEYQELIYNRQILVNDNFIEDPKHRIDSSKKNKIKIGILIVEI